MISYNIDKFLNRYKISFGKLTGEQTQGLIFLSNKLIESKRINTIPKASYVLATTYWETAHTYQPVTEYGSEKYLKSKSYYPFIGRGYVQLTWKENYIKFGKALGKDLVNNPHYANVPEIAWKILEMGMTDTELGIQDPDFTKYTLEDFFDNGKEDYLNARKIINPKDYDSYEPIKDVAIKISKCIQGSIITDEDVSNIPILI